MLLFALVASWNNYFLPLIMLNSPEKFPLPVGLAQWQSTATGGSGSQALFSTVITGSLLSIIPLVIAFLFLRATGSQGWQPVASRPEPKGPLRLWTPPANRCCSVPLTTTSTSRYLGWTSISI